MFKVFPKGMVVLNSVKFDTQSIVQIECHLKRMQEADNNNSIFISYIKYTNITPPANGKANRGRWCEDGLRFITIVEVKKKYHTVEPL